MTVFLSKDRDRRGGKLIAWRYSLLASLLLVSVSAGAADARIPDSACLACHGLAGFSETKAGQQISLYVDPALFSKSAHQVFPCTDCHSDIRRIPHPSQLRLPTCAFCHGAENTAYQEGVHGKAVAAGNARAAKCEDCHGDVHALLPATDPASRVAHANIPKTCGSCHQSNFVMEATGISTQVFVAYQGSVHGRAVAAGSVNAAVCSDCHGAHLILSPRDPRSSIDKFNVPKTCGKCHRTQESDYEQSVHGMALQRGIWSSPGCTDCHGIHSIQSTEASTISVQKMAVTTCAHCHEGVRLSAEYGIPVARVSSYRNSYHGLALQLGSTVVANCASCHGGHLILPSSDPRSSISKANLAATCGKCHVGATEKFTRFPVHGTGPAGVGNAVVRWVRFAYIVLIIVVLVPMALHNWVIWHSKTMAHRKAEGRTLVRMSKGPRIQHLILLISFVVLVITGFALLSPFSPLADAIGLTDPVRRLVHRIAGVTLIGTGVAHLIYLAFNRGGKKLLSDLLPNPTDARDLLANMKYHLSLSRREPTFGRFNYSEKVEYWALLWGTFIMAVTGLTAWFQLPVTRFLPGWVIDLALTIHLYEAILATLAILIWHIYQVILDPDVYPMNWAWWDGRVSIAHYRHEHGRDTETIAAYAPETGENGDAAGQGRAGAGSEGAEPKEPPPDSTTDHPSH